ncbi:MAG: hypothetical protein SF051_13855 [Elusimicrobiota bacterium]|nr:hypothetical protein [Elusimicrobiota bacterium]
MRALLLAAFLLPSTAAAGASDGTPALWTERQPPLEVAQIEGLRKLGFRLENDGVVMDLELEALDAAGLEQALRLLDAGESRLRLERLRHLLTAEPQDAPLSAVARERALLLATPEMAARLQDPRTTAGQLRAFAAMDLERVSAAFDGAASARGAPAVVAPAGPGPSRPHFPYLTPEEQRAGENLRAAALARLSAVERGRLVVSRLNGPDGRPQLPPILVEDGGGSPARYDYIRRALVLDREIAITALLRDTLPVDRAARRRELARPNALAAALAADPDAAARITAEHDALIAHELTHAWQDRRDPLFRQMVRGTLPPALVLEYEEEAFVEKNLYIHDLLKTSPGSYVEPAELEDYQSMLRGYPVWRDELYERYQSVETARAADLNEIRALQQRRVDEAANAPAGTPAQVRARARRMERLQTGSDSLNRVQEAHARRLEALHAAEIPSALSDLNVVLARHYLARSASETNRIQRAVMLGRARSLAQSAGDAALLASIEAALSRIGP